MPTIIEDKVEFYHVPKTGGNWVRNALILGGVRSETRGGPHDPPEGRSRNFRFCFVRHPHDWYRSFWCYRQKDGWRSEGGEEIDTCRDDSLDTFVSLVARRYPGWLSRKYRRFTRKCDFVGHTESLVDGLVEVLTRTGCRFDESMLRSVPPCNVAGRLDKYSKISLSKESKRMIREHEAEAFELYGYERSRRTRVVSR